MKHYRLILHSLLGLVIKIISTACIAFDPRPFPLPLEYNRTRRKKKEGKKSCLPVFFFPFLFLPFIALYYNCSWKAWDLRLLHVYIELDRLRTRAAKLTHETFIACTPKYFKCIERAKIESSN